jgi:hypothetical protein
VNDKLRRAIDSAKAALATTEAELKALSADTTPADVGDRYVVPDSLSTIGIEWLVVRIHPDDATTVLVVPVDTSPYVGVCDLVEGIDCARCGCAFWVVRSELRPEWRVGRSVFLAERCKRVLHLLATGRKIDATADQNATEADPNYQELIEEVLLIANKLW